MDLKDVPVSFDDVLTCFLTYSQGYFNMNQDDNKTYGDFLKAHEKDIEKINEAIMETEFHEITDIYIDLALIKDTRMGLLQTLSRGPMDIKYLIDHLDAYNHRPVRDFKYVYKDLPYTETELKNMYKDPERSSAIFNKSPDTDFSQNIDTFSKIIVTRNSRVKSRNAVKLHINTYPLTITENIRLFASMLEDYLQGIFEIDLISIPPGKVDPALWKRCDIIFLDKVLDVTYTKHSLYKVLFEDRALLISEIYAPYDCDILVLHKWEQYHIDFSNPTVVSELFKVTESLMGLYCQFQFTPFCIPTPRSYK